MPSKKWDKNNKSLLWWILYYGIFAAFGWRLVPYLFFFYFVFLFPIFFASIVFNPLVEFLIETVGHIGVAVFLGATLLLAVLLFRTRLPTKSATFSFQLLGSIILLGGVMMIPSLIPGYLDTEFSNTASDVAVTVVSALYGLYLAYSIRRFVILWGWLRGKVEESRRPKV